MVTDIEVGNYRMKISVRAFAFVPLFQNSVEAAQGGQLQGEAERTDADAHQRDDAGMLQRV